MARYYSKYYGKRRYSRKGYNRYARKRRTRSYRRKPYKRSSSKRPVLLSVPNSFNKTAIRRSDYYKLKYIFKKQVRATNNNIPVPRATYKANFRTFLHNAVKNNLLYQYYLCKNSKAMADINKAMHLAAMTTNGSSASSADANAPKRPRHETVKSEIREQEDVASDMGQAAAAATTGNYVGAAEDAVKGGIAEVKALGHFGI